MHAKKECKLAYKSLKSNPITVILILNKTEYLNKIKVVLNDKTKFLELGSVEKFDSTAKTEQAYQLKLRNWFVKGLLK